MDWINLLRSLQSDFIKRLNSGCLLNCEIPGSHSELTIISGQRLKSLREFCWSMAEKYKRSSTVRDVFVSNLKGKLGEEVVKERLADFITEVDYEKRLGGDGKSDFTVTAHPWIGIEVKSRHGDFDKVRWSVNSQEVGKNAVIVCILIREEVTEAQLAYHLFLAGFLPTKMIKLKTGRISFGIDQLLYGGGLLAYLEDLPAMISNGISQKIISSNTNGLYNSHNLYNLQKHAPDMGGDIVEFYVKLGDKHFDHGDYIVAISNYSQALQNNKKNSYYQEELRSELNLSHKYADNISNIDIHAYYKLGLAYYQLGDYDMAISNYNQVINANVNHSNAYNKRGLAHYKSRNYHSAIEDFSQAISINPELAINYKNRAEARYLIGDYQGAIEDYSQVLSIHPDLLDQPILVGDIGELFNIKCHDEVIYKNRADHLYQLGEYEEAVENYNQAIALNINYVDAYYQRGKIYFNRGIYEAAVDDFSMVIKTQPNYGDAYYYRGNCWLIMGNKQTASGDFKKAADIYWQDGRLAEYKQTQAMILEVEIEQSLDILDF
ncbi:tetratricopeptide repeat protein [Cylindrospermopsis raciborskii]|uniref:Tetratricopeptide repeat protein n=1 Tax=Cylindrospermopsis raciborskii CENA302 TaxID=1170768 RepID=A0A9Q5W9T9_9CYAN|nr:tetratricopeptide repeat protein [Cylindrospermopsis raciborskii]OPH10107.1 hypothetical protein CENA302_07250 [Cylindrospermopsis raciborskii CENA302]